MVRNCGPAIRGTTLPLSYRRSPCQAMKQIAVDPLPAHPRVPNAGPSGVVGVPHRKSGAGARTFYGNGVRICLPNHVNVDSHVGGIVGVHRFLLSPSSRWPWGATRGHRLIAVTGRPAGRGDGSEGAGCSSGEHLTRGSACQTRADGS